MPPSTVKSAGLSGLRDSLPFWLVIGPFAMLFGVVAMESGLSLLQTMAMTLVVISGAAQFTALQLMLDGAGLGLILGGALAVSLRMAMYSAALVPHLGAAPLWQRALCSYLMFDQPYALSVARYESRTEPLATRVAYYLGVGLPMAAMWTAMTAVGALVGRRLPEGLALDFALPITFIALFAPMLRTRAHVAAAVTSAAVALALAWLPSGAGLLIAAAVAMAVGAGVETLQARRRP